MSNLSEKVDKLNSKKRKAHTGNLTHRFSGLTDTVF
jgi:hypothetical protein